MVSLVHTKLVLVFGMCTLFRSFFFPMLPFCRYPSVVDARFAVPLLLFVLNSGISFEQMACSLQSVKENAAYLGERMLGIHKGDPLAKRSRSYGIRNR